MQRPSPLLLAPDPRRMNTAFGKASLVGALAFPALACTGFVMDGSGDLSPAAGSPTGNNPDPSPTGVTPGTPPVPGAGSAGSSGSMTAPAPGTLPSAIEYRGTPSDLRRLSRNEIMASAALLTGTQLTRRDLPEEPRADHGALLTGGMAFIADELGLLRIALGDFAAKATPAERGLQGGRGGG